MAGMDVMKQKNLEGSILFMQQEHATTLKGLHGEINKLQQRCSELTFQLAMEHTSLPQDKETVKENTDSVKKELAKCSQQLAEKEELLQKKDRRIENLEQQIKALDRKYKDELKHKQFSITKLETDIQERCSELASLRMTVLTTRNSHNYSRSHEKSPLDMLKHSRDVPATHMPDMSRYTPDTALSRESSFSSSRCDSQGEDLESSPYTKNHVPVPPVSTSMSSSSKKNHPFRRSSSGKVLTEVKNRPASGRKLVLDSSPDQHYNNLPDNTEILRIVAQQKETMDLRHGKGMVVPPIKAITKDPSNSGNNNSSSSITMESLNKLTPRSTNSAAFSKRVRRQQVMEKRENSSSPEIETLAVDQVINSDLRKAQEFNSWGTDS